MKTIPFILWTAGILSMLLLPLSGQNYGTTTAALQSFMTTEETPAIRQSEPASSEASPSYVYQRPGTLDAGKQITADESGTPQSGVLLVSRRTVASGSEGVLADSLAQLSANYRESAKPEESGNCEEIPLAVSSRITHDPSALLEIVETETSANPSCACEIVKAAIHTTDGDLTKIVAVVETAITTAPEHLRLISQCAIAAAPESVTEVQALLAKLDPGAGESVRSAKGAKAAVAAENAAHLKIPENPPPNPLDLPPFQFAGPPIIIPSPVTRVNP